MSAKNATAVETESEHVVVEYLADHPRMIGVLFTMLLLLTQAGNAAAGNNATTLGP